MRTSLSCCLDLIDNGQYLLHGGLHPCLQACMLTGLGFLPVGRHQAARLNAAKQAHVMINKLCDIAMVNTHPRRPVSHEGILSNIHHP